jgi:hypothetical protein
MWVGIMCGDFTYRTGRYETAAKPRRREFSVATSNLTNSEFGTKRQFARYKAMSGVGGRADLPVERPDFSL